MIVEDAITTIHRLLHEAGKPLSWGELYILLVKHNPQLIVDQKAINKLYAAMDYHAKTRGSSALIMKVGRGIWCSNTQFNPETMEAPKPNQNNSIPVARKIRQIENQTCGNCKHLEFEGIEQVKLSRGFCGMYEKTGKVGCSVKQDAAECKSWYPRSEAKKRTDLLTRDNILLSVFGGGTSKKKRRQ